MRNPQDPGEQKHGLSDEKIQAEVSNNNLNVPQTEESSSNTPADQAYRYRLFSVLDYSETRQRMEDKVRRLKRERKPRPYCSSQIARSALHLRCGDRSQFSLREDGRQQTLPHRCNYKSGIGGDHVLIVDDDPSQSQFCKSSFALFMRYAEEKILTAESGSRAIEILKACKLSSRQCGLLIADIAMPGMSGYDLVNELYERNYNVEILLMKAETETTTPPVIYFGDREILPGRPVVSGILTKPFHSDMLIEAVSRLEFGKNR